jgi:hypothetical protein
MMAQAFRSPETAPRCLVCGCDSVRTDAVEPSAARAGLLLAECPRCDHRWTEALPQRLRVLPTRPMRRVLREGASAA